MTCHLLDCYGVRVIPEGDWFCQRCHNKKFYRKVVRNLQLLLSYRDRFHIFIFFRIQNIICCTTQVGAIKRTTESTEFMHVQCAIYNKEIDHTKEPYLIDKSKLGQLVSRDRVRSRIDFGSAYVTVEM